MTLECSKSLTSQRERKKGALAMSYITVRVLALGWCGLHASEAFALLAKSPPTGNGRASGLAGIYRRTHATSRLQLRAELQGEEEKRAELLLKRKAVIRDMQDLLEDEKERVALDIRRLQEEKWRRGTEEWSEERRNSVPEEDIEDEEELPSGWDSLPWSDGYKAAMRRADSRLQERRRKLEEQGIVSDGRGIGTLRQGRRQAPVERQGAEAPKSRRSSMSSIIVRLVAGSLMVVAAASISLDAGITQGCFQRLYHVSCCVLHSVN